VTTLTADQARHHLLEVRDRPILVLGDVMLDRYLWGNVHRISPEAPVPVVDVESETVRLGGAANVAHNVAALGARPILVAVTGPDHPATLLGAELAARGLSADGLVVDAGRPTSIKTRIVARHQQVVRADQESREEISAAVEDRILAVVRERMPGLSACILSDYGKGVITRRLLDTLLPEFRAAGVPVCVDPKETHFFGYTGVSVITPNLLEAGVAFGRALRTDELLDRAGRELRERLECHAVLITRGERGMSLFEAGHARLDLPTVAREVYDVTGAGDTVISVYAALLAAGASHPVAAEIANHAAGIVVREVGTATATPEAIVASFAAGA
jgi:D-beta-D-heptose 7-phosphate kinase/D-beta-D-heptose 1-phosphate adenosyltransferase